MLFRTALVATIGYKKLFFYAFFSERQLAGIKALSHFGDFAQEVPSTLYWLGARKPGTPFYPLHSDHFAPDEAAVTTGMQVMLSTALAYLAADAS